MLTTPVVLIIWVNAHFGAIYTQKPHTYNQVCIYSHIFTEWQPKNISFLFYAVKKTSTDALQLVVERCAAASTEGPCDQMITVLR